MITFKHNAGFPRQLALRLAMCLIPFVSFLTLAAHPSASDATVPWSIQAGEAAGSAGVPPKTDRPAQPGDPSKAQQKPESGAGSQKSLDDLLGVPDSKRDAGSGIDDAADREQAKRLERSLDEASLDDLVARAVDGMKSAAQRLSDAKDPGIGTQRIQEDVVKTLDRLLEESQKQQKRQSSSSSSRSKGKPRPDQGEEPKPGQAKQPAGREQKPSQSESKGESNSEDSSDATRPQDQSSADGTALDESRIEWGRLPDRVRELVLQGRRDRVSTIYERLTREYYRRLAEEASK